ncbi:hypothetical protein GCM10027051_36030 [Niabella terrae]
MFQINDVIIEKGLYKKVSTRTAGMDKSNFGFYDLESLNNDIKMRNKKLSASLEKDDMFGFLDIEINKPVPYLYPNSYDNIEFNYFTKKEEEFLNGKLISLTEHIFGFPENIRRYIFFYIDNVMEKSQLKQNSKF